MSTFSNHLLKALLVVAAAALLCVWPAYAMAGTQGVVAALVAAGVSLVGWALGRLPHAFFRHGPDAIFHASMAGIGVRLLGTLAIAAPLMMLDVFPLTPFALGLLLTYFALLVLEVRDLVVESRKTLVAPASTPSGGSDEEPHPHTGPAPHPPADPLPGTDGAPTR